MTDLWVCSKGPSYFRACASTADPQGIILRRNLKVYSPFGMSVIWLSATLLIGHKDRACYHLTQNYSNGSFTLKMEWQKIAHIPNDAPKEANHRKSRLTSSGNQLTLIALVITAYSHCEGFEALGMALMYHFLTDHTK